jgi:hypothetical protein
MLGLGGLVPPILKLASRWECPESHYSHFTWHTSNVGLDGHHFQSGGFGEQKNMLPVLGVELQFFGHPPGSLVTPPTD